MQARELESVSANEIIETICLAAGLKVVEAVVERRVAARRLPVTEVFAQVLLDVELDAVLSLPD